MTLFLCLCASSVRRYVRCCTILRRVSQHRTGTQLSVTKMPHYIEATVLRIALGLSVRQSFRLSFSLFFACSELEKDKCYRA